MAPRNRSIKNRDLPANLYTKRDGYRYRNPQTKAFHSMGNDKAKAIAAARKLNAILMPKDNIMRRVLGEEDFTWSMLVDRYKDERQAKEGNKAATVKLENYRLDCISETLGGVNTEDTTQRMLSDWLDHNFKNNAYTKHRGTLIKLYDFGIAKGLLPMPNLARNTLPPKEDKKKRKILTIAQYKAIHEQAEPWLQVVMDFALTTLQRRGDIAKTKFDDIKDGQLHVIQAKTEKHGERAYLKIGLGDSLKAIIARSRSLPPLSPFVAHREPIKRIRFDGQEHWTQVTPQYISKAFAAARGKTGLFDDLSTAEKPSFHEIRALGGARYLEQGYSKEHVNLLMGHTTQRMTNEYTEQHINWTECTADLSL